MQDGGGEAFDEEKPGTEPRPQDVGGSFPGLFDDDVAYAEGFGLAADFIENRGQPFRAPNALVGQVFDAQQIVASGKGAPNHEEPDGEEAREDLSDPTDDALQPWTGDCHKRHLERKTRHHAGHVVAVPSGQVMRLDMVETGVFYRLMECVRAEYGLTTQ